MSDLHLAAIPQSSSCYLKLDQITLIDELAWTATDTLSQAAEIVCCADICSALSSCTLLVGFLLHV